MNMEPGEWMRKNRPERNPAYLRIDIGAAQMFYDFYADEICYVTEARSWYLYDRRRWIKDVGGLRVMEMCKEFMCALFRYVVEL